MGRRAQRRSLPMNESQLRRALAATAHEAIPDGTRLSTDVLTLALARPPRRTHRGLRFRVAFVTALALASLTAAGAVAVASGTLPAQFNLIQPRTEGDKDAGGSDAAKEKVAAFDAKSMA